MTSIRPVGAYRGAALGTGGAVTSSHPAVSRLGAQVLSEGGNAFEATVAVAALAWVVLPGQCGPGGDAFALVREPDGRVWTLAGSGLGPDGGTPGFYRGRGLTALPLSGALSVSAPGAPGVIRRLGERAARSLGELWAPAVRAAEAGVPCTPKTLADVTKNEAALAGDPGTASVYLRGGRLPRVGDLLFQPDLSRTLRRLAEDPGAFHAGWFADRALEWLASQGAPFSGEEWRLAADIPAEPPITAGYGGLLLHETPQPSPGWMVLHQARILDGELARLDQLGAEAIHWLAGAAAESFRYRLEHCGSGNDAWRGSLAPTSVLQARQRIGDSRSAFTPAHSPGAPVGPGDTTTTVCVDADGTAISFIHSLAFTFGAKATVPGTGVVLNNRLGRGAYLIDGHPNEVRPRQRPMNTLNAWLLSDSDGLVAVGNCPGGDGQVQWNMQVISHLVDHGDDPQRAVSLPRVTVFPGSDADTLGRPQVLRCEEGLDPAALSRLESWGHRVERVPVQRGGPGGSALAVTLDSRRRVLSAAADPRMDGVSLAL